MIRVHILLIVFVVTVTAQIPSLGFCPEYPPMSDFELDRFLGKWYEVERYFQISEVAARCVVTDYAKAPSGKIYVSNEITNRLTGIKRIIGGYLESAGRADEGKLRVKYSTTPISTETTLIVLDTDYETYAVIWSCNGFGPLHAQSIWIMTRERIPPGPVLQTVYGVLDKFKISRTFFVKTDQEGCALAASDINAANGITAVSTLAETTGSLQRNKESVDKERLQSETDSPKQAGEVIINFAPTENQEQIDIEEVEGLHDQLEEFGYLGKWYEAERYFALFEFGGKCVTAEYEVDSNGAVNIANQQISALTGIRSTIEGNASLSGRTDEAKLSINFPSLPVNFDAPYWVLDTDYVSYSVVWSCNNFGILSTRNAWILTREKNPPLKAMEKAYAALDKQSISRAYFIRTDQKNCPATY
ncbi:hypothetical protein NQ317_009777 [Molorchus minor]|uniref:Lipocalin/cytosolic fatty-acid binding domain-containing protein n=1 Tax=Molorchus minor TaxID=1323400 RepID=A0ABQ9K3W8_9CUCU|nr:hypothetical protein NQ317_009777 [Molorchus minor]